MEHQLDIELETNISLHNYIRRLPYELQDVIYIKHWRKTYSNEVVKELDKCLKHRLYLYTENLVCNLHADSDTKKDSDIVIKPMMYKTVENDPNNSGIFIITYYDSIAYSDGHVKSEYTRPWKVATFLTYWSSSNASHRGRSIKIEMDQQQVYDEHLTIYRCPIYTRLDKVTDYWNIGDKYYDRRDYQHLLTPSLST